MSCRNLRASMGAFFLTTALESVELSSLPTPILAGHTHMNDAPGHFPSGIPTELTDTEQTIASLWNEVLRNTTFPAPMDNFFALGGDSMAMITLEFRIKEETGVALAPGTLLSAPTLRELSQAVDALLSESHQPFSVPDTPQQMPR